MTIAPKHSAPMKLSAKGVSFGYGETSVFKNLDFQCSAGSSIWLGGQSGTGKSTFLKLMAGLLPAQSGEISWNDVHFSKLNETERAEFRRANVGYGDQEVHLVPAWTVEQNLRLASEVSPYELLKEFELESFASKRVSTLSGGQKQRVMLARLILQNPQILLLDEPTAHLDDRTTELVMSAIKKHCAHATTIVVSHDARIGKWIGEQVTMDRGGIRGSK
jgi:ABC-type lipoprotein export system ATPase subunit